jgi:bifunctional UDP-N-acetylglucosamine pyrophosphorylase/glucosamine-1-phosphate N-acetyltransferase
MNRAIVLAAGKGTRMKSPRPKVLHELCGRPMLWYVLEALAAAGVDDVTVVASPELQPELEGAAVRTVVQEPQLGTGHAVQIALAALEPADGTVVIANGDMPLVTAAVFEDVLAAVDPDAGAALALVTARMPHPSSFGRIVRNGGSVARIVELRDCTPAERAIEEHNAGVYAFSERALRAVIGRLRDDNAQCELYLTDTVELLLGSSHRVVPVAAEDYRAVLGVNDRVELAAARAVLNARLCEAHMRAGVTIVDPATTYLEPGLEIGSDTVIAPNTAIGGRTVIGARAHLGPNTRIRDCRLGDEVRIVDSVVSGSVIDERVTIGPFAHLRDGNVIGAATHIGNFVEVKNTRTEPGVKAGHLAYLGDAAIGENANIGAGTITCNYDGVRKNETWIGRNAFIGSNSALVAPVRIGNDALTGAGAVVIRDVPDGERVVGNPARTLGKKGVTPA